jgi:hypothetical protein
METQGNKTELRRLQTPGPLKYSKGSSILFVEDGNQYHCASFDKTGAGKKETTIQYPEQYFNLSFEEMRTAANGFHHLFVIAGENSPRDKYFFIVVR